MRLTPFQSAMKEFHHSISERNDRFRRTRWCGWRTPPNSWNIRPMNVLPGRTTLAACANFPVRDSSSLRVQALRPRHCFSSLMSSFSFPGGSRVMRDSESRVNPRKSSTVVGPSNFSSATGRPSRLNVSMSVWRDCSQPPEAGGAHYKEIVEVVYYESNSLLLGYPLHCVSHGCEYLRSRS